ncbi:hypothetical protein O6H91_05G015400 [Diphasiastrum complanatum]|uniref:Uncharacterized protein n=1 Tax=Diphasiastrum complanatum TaxID=34168 RepID=A0ACC2DL52_DIPCM|nr:hypothetical protein O6H91_05G015400 [Diphasiastrum complanatum]
MGYCRGLSSYSLWFHHMLRPATAWALDCNRYRYRLFEFDLYQHLGTIKMLRRYCRDLISYSLWFTTPHVAHFLDCYRLSESDLYQHLGTIKMLRGYCRGLIS